MSCCQNNAGVKSTKYDWPDGVNDDKSVNGIIHSGGWRKNKTFPSTYNYLIKKSKDKLSGNDLEEFKAELCAALKIIDLLKKDSNKDEETGGDQNIQLIEGYFKKLNPLCADAKKNQQNNSNNNQKSKTIEGCMDNRYEEYNPDATKDTEPTSCITLIKVEEVPLVAGCMDDGENLPKGVTVVNYNPDAEIDLGCKYKTNISVSNNYMFCTDSQDGAFDGCDPSEAKNILDGYITPGKYGLISSFPKSVMQIESNLTRIVEDSINNMRNVPYIPLRNENKFTKDSITSLSNDIVKALTVSVAETQYKKDENDKEWRVYPFTYVTVYSPGGATDPIAEFKIIRDESIDAPIGITGIVPTDSTSTFRKRINNLSQPSVDPSYVNAVNKHITQYLKIKDIKFNNEGLLVERIPSIGLGKLLDKPTTGLENLLK